MERLIPLTAYQGSKRRFAKDIVNILLQFYTHQYYDLCCGTGSISMQLLSQGISPTRITMIDIGLWGMFWESISTNTFNIHDFLKYYENIPTNPKKVQEYIIHLSEEDPEIDTIYKFILLQACNFGGKAIRLHEGQWKNISIKPYWTPSKNSVRQYPSYTFTTSPPTILKRLKNILTHFIGIHAYQCDIHTLSYSSQSCIYIDPGYKNSYGYRYSVNIDELVSSTHAPIYVSEGYPLTSSPYYKNAYQISHARNEHIFNAKRTSLTQEEWLTLLQQ